MSYFNSRVSKFLIDDTGSTQRDISAYIRELTGLPGAHPLAKITALGDSGEVWQPDIENTKFFMKGLYNDQATTGPDAVLGPIARHTAAVDFEYGVAGNGSGATKYSGQCWLYDYELRSIVGTIVEFIAKFQVDDVVTRGTFT